MCSFDSCSNSVRLLYFLAVGDYKKVSTGSTQVQVSSCAKSTVISNSTECPVLETEDFISTLIYCNTKTLQIVISDPIYSLTCAKNSALSVQYAREMVTTSYAIADYSSIVVALSDVFVNRRVVAQSDRESLMMDINIIRQSTIVRDSFVEYVKANVSYADEGYCRIFFQVWLRKFAQQMICILRELCTGSVPLLEVSNLSEVDQNVLYHIWLHSNEN